MMEKLTLLSKQASLVIFFGLLAYMPFHILISTWFGSSTDTLEASKVAKDGWLVLGFLLTLGVSFRQKWFKPLLKDKLLWLILAYAALTLLLALLKPTDTDAEILGVVYNTRFLLFFLYGILLVHLWPEWNLKWLAVRTVLATGAIVVLFGLVQYFFLPNDALIHIGYARDNGVIPAFFIDEKPDLERVMATLRDPNSLGSYLIIVGMIVSTVLLATKKKLTQRGMSIFLILTVGCLWVTFSRSALLGFALAAATYLVLAETRFKQMLMERKRLVGAIALAIVIVLAGALLITKDTYVVKNVIFHADDSTVLEDPNQLRLRFWKESAKNITHNPEGSGPGTAGLASIKNDVQGTILNENYYLQIATEAGLLGLVLFLAILAVVAWRLFKERGSLLALALLASLVGLSFTNLLVHIWSNEAVAYTWWGLAALVLAHKPPPARAKRS